MGDAMLPPSVLVAMMDTFGRHEFGVGGAAFGLEPRGGETAPVDVWESIIVPLAVLAQADPAGFVVALRNAVLPVDGWPVYGASHVLHELLGGQLAHPACNEICVASLALLREWGVPDFMLTGHEWRRWINGKGRSEPWLTGRPKPTPVEAPITELSPGEVRRIAQVTENPGSNVVLVGRGERDGYCEIIESCASDSDPRRVRQERLRADTLNDLYWEIGTSFQIPSHWHHPELAPYFPLPRPRLPDDPPMWAHDPGGDSVDLTEIADLAAMVASPTEGTDLAELNGLLGVALLDWYNQDSDIETLSHAVSYLHDALALDSGHPDRVLWYGSLGTGYGERARRTDHIEDYDAAVTWTAAALAELPPDDPDFDPLNVALAEYCFDRFYARRSGQEWGEPTARAEAELLVSALEPLTAGDPEAASYLRMLLGMAHLERFGFTEAPEDLDRAIPMLAAALSELPPDTPRRGVAGAELVNAHRLRFGVTHDRKELDRAIATAADLIGASDPDQPEWSMLHQHQAEAYEKRYEETTDPADLDRAIACWQVPWETEAEAWAAVSRSILLNGRAHLTTPPSPADLAEAAQGIELALQHGGFATDELLPVHWWRLLVMLSRTGLPDGAPEVGERRQLVEEAHAALAAAATASVDLRALLAGVLVFGEFSVFGAELDRFERGEGDAALSGLQERASELLALAAQVPDPPPEWRSVLDWGYGILEIPAVGAGADPAGAAERMARAANLFGPDLQKAALMLTQIHSTDTGDRRGYQMAVSRVAATAGSASFESIWAQATSALYEAQRGNTAALPKAVRQLVQALDELPASRSNDLLLAPLVRSLQHLSAALEKRPSEAPPVGDAASLPVDSLVYGPYLMARAIEVGSHLAGVAARSDLSGLWAIAAELEELASVPTTNKVARVAAVALAGLAYLEIARRDRTSPVAAEQAVRWCEEAAALAGGPQHPLWSMLAVNLAESLRLSAPPDRTRTRELGWSALRGHAWLVLRQAGTVHALDAARDTAAADVYKVARWCLDDQATEELVAVLDAGRGLVLNAATASRGIADQLAEQGHPDLADEWRATAGLGRDRLTGEVLTSAADDGQIPDDLRLRALQALEPEVLEPIRVGEVQTGLTSLSADALVYLVPDKHGPALAVLVPRSGPVETIALPELTTGPDSPLAQYAGAAHGARDVDPATVHSGSLDETCAWAWRAAMAPLVAHVQQWRLSRPARLVLVAMGTLGIVPWHAAFTPRGTGRRYAVEDLVVSYSPSARMMCRAAERPDQPIRSALVVGDPGGDLAGAGAEARAIHRRFYPDGAYFGKPAAAGEGTPEEVLAWVETAAPGPSLLHFACHGRVDADQPADAHLVLAHGRRMAARDLLDASRLAALEIDTVYLAACTTHVSGTDCDEVMSLATAFLAAGARTVFGSLWRVPDDATSLLMYLVHHHLNVEACPPAQALHRAQQWMLDPCRQPPPGMPAELARLCARPDLADPISWAGFTHLGR